MRLKAIQTCLYPFVRRGVPDHNSTLEQGCEMTLMPLIFSSLKPMTCGAHTSGPSSTSERSDMATRGALRCRPRSLVAHRRGHSYVLAVGGARARGPRGSSTPPVARVGLGGALPHRSSAGLGEQGGIQGDFPQHGCHKAASRRPQGAPRWSVSGL
jgi:hypothetical protein